MRALVVHHAAHEGLAGFTGPLSSRGYAIDRLDVADPDFAAADVLEPDLLVLLGGPMAAYEPAAYPWIEGELARIALRIAARRPTLGICLGAQLIAAALGADVRPGSVREVGFAPLRLTDAGKASPLAALDRVPVLHWHGDGFALPDGATLLAETDVYPQAFSLGNTILALQCHPEMGGAEDGIEAWFAADGEYVAQAGTSIERLRDDHRRFGPAADAAGRTMIDGWLAGL